MNFIQKRGLISLVNDNHVNNNLKEILVYVYFGSILNNWPKTAFYVQTGATLHSNCNG